MSIKGKLTRRKDGVGMESFAGRLRDVLKERDYSQAQLCRMTGITSSSASMYLSGKSTPTKSRRRKIAKALGLQDDYFEQGVDLAEVETDVINLPVKVAARLMGKSPEWVMQGLKDGVFPWGYAVKVGRWSFFISSAKFTECTGIRIPTEALRKDAENGAA